jgi:hypothetical protein
MGQEKNKQTFLRYIKIGFYGLCLILYVLFVGLVKGFYSFFKAVVDESKKAWVKLQDRVKET